MQALESREEITAAQAQLVQRFRDRGAQEKRQRLGFQGGSTEADVLWIESLNLWLAVSALSNRHWNAFGVNNIIERPRSIVIEANVPFQGANKRVSGLYVRTPDGRTFLAHSGTVGGARKGMSRNAFLESYGAQPATVQTSRGPREMLLLGDVADPTLPDSLAKFVGAVRAFKESVGAGEVEPSEPWDEFVDWCCEALSWSDFDVQERDYKLRVGENMAAARQAFLARTSDWPAQLKRGFGSPNNMTSYYSHEPFYQWAETEPDAAAAALDHVWAEDSDPVAGIDAFRAAIPREVLKGGVGTCLNIASALLLGRDVNKWTIYKHRLNVDIFRVSGTPLPPKSSPASEVYAASVALFDRLVDAMRENGANVRDALDAQGAAYSILRNEHFFESLDADTRAELMHFIGREGESADIDEPAAATNMDQPRRSHPLNQILYGPPGTGKTYRTRELALEICGVAADDERIAQREYKELIAAGRVGFVTFHQSYSYEDFVEGIRPELDREAGPVRYELKDGIFKTICDRARRTTSRSASAPQGALDQARVWKMSLKSDAATSEDLFQDCVSGSCILLGWGEDVDLSAADDRQSVIAAIEKVRGSIQRTSYEITAVHLFRNEVQVGDLIVVPDGSQRVRAIGRVTGTYAGLDEATNWHKRPVEWLSIFEPSIPREELGVTNQFSARTIYSLPADRIDRDAIAGHIAQSSQTDGDSGTPLPCVLIIDEINRANVSKVLGELITLIEPDKRLGGRNELKVTLPYSRQRFGVPSNLFIVGTMNTADRSIAFLDVALRRRFTFTELMPDPALVDEHVDIPGISAGELLRCMNDRIELLLDRDHTIGHAYFFEVDSLRKLRDRFTRRIIPLLQEYFYQDGRKVAQVLGCGVDEAGRSNHEHPILTATSRSADRVIGPDADDFDTLLTFRVNEQFANAGPDELPLYFRGILERAAN